MVNRAGKAGKAGKAWKTPIFGKWAGKAGKRYIFFSQRAGKAGICFPRFLMYMNIYDHYY